MVDLLVLSLDTPPAAFLGPLHVKGTKGEAAVGCRGGPGARQRKEAVVVGGILQGRGLLGDGGRGRRSGRC